MSREAASPAVQPDALLANWAAHGWLRQLDIAFARFLAREAPQADPLLIFAAALTSHQLGHGHVCLNLSDVLADPGFALALPPEDAAAEAVDETLRATFDALPLQRWLAAFDCPALVGDGAGDTPLVRADDRLYLRRYWRYEQSVYAAIDARLKNVIPIDPADLRSALNRLFPDTPPDRTDWQKIACALSARSHFSIITGSPGTGKTTTVVKLAALLQTLALQATGAPLRIRMAAPTGKASARLAEALTSAIARLPADDIRAAIPTEAATLHRLLGFRPNSRRFRHNAANPLPLDVLIVDEASMIDLEMMANLLAALPDHARLVLLGDKDQLASVEAGAVLGELCRNAERGGYTPGTRQWIQEATGQQLDADLFADGGSSLDQAVTMLRFSHRFHAGGGIGRLSDAVNRGNTLAALELLHRQDGPLGLLEPADERAPQLMALMLDGAGHGDGYRHYLETMRAASPGPNAGQPEYDAWAEQTLRAYGRFQVLCALRTGAWGVEGQNRAIAAALHRAGLIPAEEGWYSGRPVLMTRNDYVLDLMNGDIGITLRMPGKDGASTLQIAFAGADGIRWFHPARLQAVETVYALTIHKSQGSEFDHAVLVLPPMPVPVLTRELLYTGITRARSRMTLVNPGGERLLKLCVERKIRRSGGWWTERD